MGTDSINLASALRDDDQPGFALHRGFADAAIGNAMLDEVIAIARSAASGNDVTPAWVVKESQEGFVGHAPEDYVAKIFKLHRTGTFRSFLALPEVASILVAAIGPDVDCFLSQFIFKNPGAWGQPWHQDSYYFPFEPARPIVGLWLAVTRATLENGCLHVLPGSQAEPVHQHVPDSRPGSVYGYVEIVDHDMDASAPCLLSPGDLMVFDSHLMHRSTDNLSDEIRAAMVWHFCRPGTVDLGIEIAGTKIESPLNDFMPVIRDGIAVGDAVGK